MHNSTNSVSKTLDFFISLFLTMDKITIEISADSFSHMGCRCDNYLILTGKKASSPLVK